MKLDGEEELIVHLRDEFCLEGQEALFACEGILLNMDRDGQSEELIREFNRLLHSIKGSAAAVEMVIMTKVIHKFETYIGKRDDSLVDISFHVIDNLRDALVCTKDGLFDKSDKILDQVVKLIE